MDALSYTTLSESNISSKLPEIAMRQYKIAEANREKTEKQHTDLIGLFKYKVEGFNPDITGLTKGYEAIVQKGSEIALKQGYSAAQQYVQTQKDLLDGIGKMSSAQKQKSDLLFKDLSDKKKWNEDPEGYMQSMENYKKYVMSDEPTKQDYANIRKKYGYSDAIPDEALRAVIRQNTFGEGESILNYEPIGDYRKGAKDWALNPTTKETSMGEYTMGKDGNIYHGTKTEVKYNKSMLENQMSDFFALGKTNTGASVYKAAERELKKSGAIPQNVDVNTPEGYKQVFDAWKTRPSTMELFKKEGEKTTMSESKISEGKGIQFSFGSGNMANDKYNMSSDVSKNVSTPTGDRQKDISLPTVVINKVGSEAVAVTIPTSEYIEVYNPAKKTFEQKTNRSGQITVDDYELRKHDNGWYLHGTSVMNTGEKKSKTDKSVTPIYTKVNVAIPISNNLSVISKRFGFEPEQLEDVMNTAVDKYTGMYPNQTTHKKTYEYIGKDNKTNNQSTPTQQKSSNKKTTVSGGSIR